MEVEIEDDEVEVEVEVEVEPPAQPTKKSSLSSLAAKIESMDIKEEKVQTTKPQMSSLQAALQVRRSKERSGEQRTS